MKISKQDRSLPVRQNSSDLVNDQRHFGNVYKTKGKLYKMDLIVKLFIKNGFNPNFLPAYSAFFFLISRMMLVSLLCDTPSVYDITLITYMTEFNLL